MMAIELTRAITADGRFPMIWSLIVLICSLSFPTSRCADGVEKEAVLWSSMSCGAGRGIRTLPRWGGGRITSYVFA